MMTQRFENKVAAITGATSGIGLEVVKRLVAEGAQVVANFLLSPAAQARKADIAHWGDPTVLALDKLPPAERARFLARPLPGQLAQTMPTLPEPHGSWVEPLEKEGLRRYG